MGRGKQDPNFSIIYFNVKRKVKGLQSCKENKNICQEYFKWLLLLNYKYNSEILLIMKKFRIYTQTPPGKTNDLVITYNKPKHKGKLKGWEQSVCVRSFAVMLTSFDPMGCSPSGSSVCGIFQARILQWVATFFARGSSQPTDGTHISASPALAGRFFTT